MKFSIARSDLLEALSAAGRALSARSTLPILSGILVEVSADGTVVVQATDLEVSVRHSVRASVEAEGTTVFPGRLTTDIIRSFPEAAVSVSVDRNTATISCETSSFSVKTMSSDDFPKFPHITAQDTVDIDTKTFASLVGHVARAVSRDETRPILTGVLVVVDGPTLRMVATDSYRLAVKEVILERDTEAEVEVVVPGKALEEIGRLATAESITMGVAENQAVFTFGPTTFVSRRIEGTFPNWRQLIPKEAETHFTVGLEEFTQAVKRVSLMAQHNTPLRVSVSVENQTASLSATTQDIGEASENLMVQAEGTDVEIAFNHGFLSDGLAAARGEKATVEIVSPLKPGVIRVPDDEGFLYLLMPVRLG